MLVQERDITTVLKNQLGGFRYAMNSRIMQRRFSVYVLSVNINSSVYEFASVIHSSVGYRHMK